MRSLPPLTLLAAASLGAGCQPGPAEAMLGLTIVAPFDGANLFIDDAWVMACGGEETSCTSFVPVPGPDPVELDLRVFGWKCIPKQETYSVAGDYTVEWSLGEQDFDAWESGDCAVDVHSTYFVQDSTLRADFETVIEGDEIVLGGWADPRCTMSGRRYFGEAVQGYLEGEFSADLCYSTEYHHNVNGEGEVLWYNPACE